MFGSDNSTTTAGARPTAWRRLGWLAAALLTVAALLGPTVGTALAEHTEDDVILVTDFTLGSGFENPCAEGTTAIKLDEADIVEGTHTYVFGDTGIEIELEVVLDEGEGNEIDSIEVISITGDAVIYVHAGEGTTLQLVEGMVIDPEKGISFVLFCVTPAAVTTTTTTDAVTTTTTSEQVITTTTTDDVTTTTTSEQVITTTTNTGGVNPTTTTSATTTGAVSGVVGGPGPTLPPTSTVDAEGRSTTSTVSLVLLVAAALTLAVVLIRPLSTRKSEDR